MPDTPEEQTKQPKKTNVVVKVIIVAVILVPLTALALSIIPAFLPYEGEGGRHIHFGFGEGYDFLDDTYWENLDEFIQYKQIVKDSPFKLGKIRTKIEGENEYDEDYNVDHFQSYGTYPLIDGSTVCVPMAIEFTRQHLNMNLGTAIYFNYFYNKTHEAYMALIKKSTEYYRYYWEGNDNDEVIDMDETHPCDLFLGTEPSNAELDYAKSQNIKLYKQPICLDAFVFIVNKDNPVDSLTAEQIRGIYSGKIKNWSELGGKDEAILPFQRRPNSGSQTGMENIVMNGRKMIPALSHTSYSTMGGLVEGVAEYDNGKASIGYSYKYFVDTIYKNDNVKIISVDGTAPDAENVRSGKYPFSTYYYGVIRDEDRAKTGGKFLDWILSEEGQKCVKQAGYITLK